MNTSTLHLAPKSTRLAIAKHLLFGVAERHAAEQREQRHGDDRRRDDAEENQDHARSLHVLMPSDAAMRYATPSAKPARKPSPSRSSSSASAAPIAMTTMKVMALRIYAATWSIGEEDARATSASSASAVRGSTSSAPLSSRDTVDWFSPSIAASSACVALSALRVRLIASMASKICPRA